MQFLFDSFPGIHDKYGVFIGFAKPLSCNAPDKLSLTIDLLNV